MAKTSSTKARNPLTDPKFLAATKRLIKNLTKENHELRLLVTQLSMSQEEMRKAWDSERLKSKQMAAIVMRTAARK